MHVVNDDAHAFFRHFDPVAPLQRALGVLIAARPVLAHRGAREFVILGITFVSLLLVDQLQDGDLRQISKAALELTLLVSAKSVRMCERAVLTNRPSLDLSPFALKGREPDGERGTDPVSSSTRTVAWASSPDRARKGAG